jgi:DNA-binding HxlR family transcriptional regulator
LGGCAAAQEACARAAESQNASSTSWSAENSHISAIRAFSIRIRSTPVIAALGAEHDGRGDELAVGHDIVDGVDAKRSVAELHETAEVREDVCCSLVRARNASDAGLVPHDVRREQLAETGKVTVGKPLEVGVRGVEGAIAHRGFLLIWAALGCAAVFRFEYQRRGILRQEGTPTIYRYPMETRSELASPVWDPYQPSCPSRLVLARIADKWTLLILGQLATGKQRFGQLRRHVGGITQKVLTSTLRSLERDGFVSRRMYAAVPPKVEYSLTPLGLSLVDLVTGLRTWAIEHVPDVLDAQVAYDHRPLEPTEIDAP